MIVQAADDSQCTGLVGEQFGQGESALANCQRGAGMAIISQEILPRRAGKVQDMYP